MVSAVDMETEHHLWGLHTQGCKSAPLSSFDEAQLTSCSSRQISKETVPFKKEQVLPSPTRRKRISFTSNRLGEEARLKRKTMRSSCRRARARAIALCPVAGT